MLTKYFKAEKEIKKKKPSKPQDRYKFVKKLAEGAQGSALLYVHRETKNNIVLKVSNNKSGEADIKAEKAIYRRLMKKLSPSCKKYFPKFFDFKGDFDNYKVYIALEYVQGKTLKDHMLYTFKPNRSIINSVQDAIMCMWKSGVVHGDLHLNNIMIDSKNNIKLIDFGAGMMVSPYTGKQSINVWFTNKQLKMFGRINNRKSFVFPSNPNHFYFGYNVPFYAESHKRMIKNLIGKDNNVSKPYTTMKNLRKLSKMLRFKETSKMKRNELINKVYSIDRKRLEKRFGDYYPHDEWKAKNMTSTQLYKKLLDF